MFQGITKTLLGQLWRYDFEPTKLDVVDYRRFALVPEWYFNEQIRYEILGIIGPASVLLLPIRNKGRSTKIRG